MPSPDPAQMESFLETYNLKQLSDDSSVFRRALNDIIVDSVKAHHTIMTALESSVQSNQDIRDKFASKWLEVGPIEAASVGAILQQALKAAQTTPPPTTGK